MDDVQKAMSELLVLAAQRRGATLEELDRLVSPNSETWENEKAYDIANSLGQAALLCSDAEYFCRLADAIGGDDSDSVLNYWSSMDTDPREAVNAQAPTAYKIISNYAGEDI